MNPKLTHDNLIESYELRCAEESHFVTTMKETSRAEWRVHADIVSYPMQLVCHRLKYHRALYSQFSFIQSENLDVQCISRVCVYFYASKPQRETKETAKHRRVRTDKKLSFCVYVIKYSRLKIYINTYMSTD